MPATFDGNNLIITLPAPVAGVVNVDVKVDLYSDWKEWVKTGNNSKYALAFRSSGGDPLTPSTTQGSYYFLQNQDGWRIRPYEANATIYFVGNLAPGDVALPLFIPTVGGYTTAIISLQPVVESVAALAAAVSSNAGLTLGQFIALR